MIKNSNKVIQSALWKSNLKPNTTHDIGIFSFISFCLKDHHHITSYVCQYNILWYIPKKKCLTKVKPSILSLYFWRVWSRASCTVYYRYTHFLWLIPDFSASPLTRTNAKLKRSLIIATRRTDNFVDKFLILKENSRIFLLP